VSEPILERIREALVASADIFAEYEPGKVEAEKKAGGDPVTKADNAVDELLRELLPRDGEGWLSEETTDDLRRLESSRVWVVDPLDGTKEFVLGIPEWCVSIGYVEDGVPIAGGIFNPQSGETIIGGRDVGVEYNGESAALSPAATLDGAVVLGSRSESKRGEWELFDGASFTVRPMGSVAYKLGLVAAGKADATWTVVPKNEWDVAAGVALVLASGGVAYEPTGVPRTFNSRDPLLTGLVAHSKTLAADIKPVVERHRIAQAAR
jgi:myo-inositol-1(or 4)-monophosphatase